MERTTKILFIILSLFVIDAYAFDTLQQEMTSGKVVMDTDEQGVQDVTISIDNQEEIISDAKGNFEYATGEVKSHPNSIIVYKEGLEIANWRYENDVLTIYMRRATMKTLEGTLINNGIPVAAQQISLEGDSTFTAVSDKEGHFSVKVPYHHDVSLKSQFKANDVLLKISDFNEYPKKAQVTLTLEWPGKKINKVLVVDEKQSPFIQTTVSISGDPYITGDDGTFTTGDTVSYKVADWVIDDNNAISISSEGENDIITAVFLRPISENLLTRDIPTDENKEMIDTLLNTSNVDSILQNEINNLIDFYNTISIEVEKRNQTLSFIIDSLSNVSELDSLKRDAYLAQVDELNKSIGTTSEDFNRLRSTSTELMERLQMLLRTQEEKIRLIEQEKEEQARKFRNDLLFVLSILGIATLLLVVVIFIARRINARKRVVERVKKQLDDAQAIAKIASMTYFIKKKQHQYSNHFFNILGISDSNRINKMHRTTSQYINDELLPKNQLKKVNDAFQRSLLTKESLFMEIKVRSDNNKELFVDLRSKIEQNSAGAPIAISSTLQDVTEKKEREFQLIEAKTEAERANKEKEDFLSTMSHEIRTPLNGIIGLTDHLINSQPPKHQEENLNTLKFSADHLLSLVNDVLDFNKIQAGKMILVEKTFNLKKHMENTVKAMTRIALYKGINLELDFQDDVPHMVKGDKVRLNQVITNLLNNGIKFTDRGSVKLTVKSGPSNNGKVNIHFNVKDTGIGIESSKLEKIFESFEQESITTSNKYGGTGLGLTISRQLVKQFGGELAVRSQQGEGSEFYFSIPFTSIDQNEAEKQLNDSSKLSVADFAKLKILCVEDNEVNQLVISQYFENWKINYAFAGTGAEGLEKFRKETYDIVFMDINLPDQNGDEVVLKMKDEFPDTACAFIAMSAETGESLKSIIKRSSMSGYLSKPFSNEELKMIIRKCGKKKNIY